MKIKISKSQWELMGKKAGWINETAGCPFTVDSLIRSAFLKGFLSTDIIDKFDDRIRDAAQGLVEQFSNWPEDQGWGSSDTNGAIRSMLKQAGIPEPTQEQMQKNREIAKAMGVVFGG